MLLQNTKVDKPIYTYKNNCRHKFDVTQKQVQWDFTPTNQLTNQISGMHQLFIHIITSIQSSNQLIL
jgi:predicted nucleic acid-binding Zn ribbon protein